MLNKGVNPLRGGVSPDPGPRSYTGIPSSLDTHTTVRPHTVAAFCGTGHSVAKAGYTVSWLRSMREVEDISNWEKAAKRSIQKCLDSCR